MGSCGLLSVWPFGLWPFVCGLLSVWPFVRIPHRAVPGKSAVLCTATLNTMMMMMMMMMMIVLVIYAAHSKNMTQFEVNLSAYHMPKLDGEPA